MALTENICIFQKKKHPSISIQQKLRNKHINAIRNPIHVSPFLVFSKSSSIQIELINLKIVDLLLSSQHGIVLTFSYILYIKSRLWIFRNRTYTVQLLLKRVKFNIMTWLYIYSQILDLILFLLLKLYVLVLK